MPPQTCFREEPRDLQRDRWQQFQQACQRQQLDLEQLNKALNRFSQSSLLVLGDTIVDQYIACDPLGMSAEAPVLVVRELKAREYLGGARLSPRTPVHWEQSATISPWSGR